MNLNNIQRLIDILNDSPGITEVAVTAPDGAKIAVRRSAAPFAGMNEIARSTAEPYEFEEDEIEDADDSGVPQGPQVITVPATMVGIFHCANPALGSGSSVSTGQIVGYIESMKLMNEVVANSAGTVAEVLIEENMPVEYGQPLFRLSSRD